MRLWPELSRTNAEYLRLFEPVPLRTYLNNVSSEIVRHLELRGLRWIAARLDTRQTPNMGPRKMWSNQQLQMKWRFKRSVALEKEHVADLSLLRIHAGMARSFRKRKMVPEMLRAYAKTYALSEEMRRHFLVVRRAYNPIPPLNAEARFFLVEPRRQNFLKIPFDLAVKLPVEAVKNMRYRVVEPLISLGARQLAKDYDYVFAAGVRRWSMAANFRRIQINEILIRRASKALETQKAKRKHPLVGLIQRWRLKSFSGYSALLKQAASFEDFDEWVHHALKRYRLLSNELNVRARPRWWPKILQLEREARNKSRQAVATQLIAQMVARCRSF